MNEDFAFCFSAFNITQANEISQMLYDAGMNYEMIYSKSEILFKIKTKIYLPPTFTKILSFLLPPYRGNLKCEDCQEYLTNPKCSKCIETTTISRNTFANWKANLDISKCDECRKNTMILNCPDCKTYLEMKKRKYQ